MNDDFDILNKERQKLTNSDYIRDKIINVIQDNTFDSNILRSILFRENEPTNEIKTNIINRIKDLHDECKKKSIRKEDIEPYVSQIILPQIEQASTVNDQKLPDISQIESEAEVKSNDREAIPIDENLKKLIKKYPNGIDTSNEDFKNIKSDYKKFFKMRCDEIVNKGENEQKNAFKDDPELREFMIRHNRFIPLFNLRFISPELLDQMATRFARMKKDPDDIQREYDKIELVSSK